MPFVVYTIALLFVLALHAGPASARDQYRVQVADGLQTVEVTACFQGQPPPYLYRHRDAARFVEYFRIDGQDAEANGRRVSLRSAEPGACASWQVNLAAAARDTDYRTALAFNQGIVTAGSLWFWRDSRQRAVEVAVHLPAGMQFSAPWTLLQADDGVLRYRPVPTPANWSSRLAVGRFATRIIGLPGGSLQLAMLGDFDAARQATVAQWIAEPAAAVAGVMGRFPRSHTQVLVIGIGPRSSPVPWAHVLRGGGAAIELFADETRSLEEFRADWTATHEFSHLLLPYVASQDRWLSEGLASYYQNVLRARDGRLSERQAWQKLVNGFRRGQNDSRAGGTMDTYWRGAALLLQADSRLRALSGESQSLDHALVALAGCCSDPGQRWSARELLRRMDQLTGTRVFSEIHAQAEQSPAFPDPQATLQKLGVESRRNSVRLDDTAPWSDIRRQIMGAAPARLASEEDRADPYQAR